MGKIRQAARMRPCSLRLPGCRNDPETTVFAHAPSVDKGTGFKSPDWWGAFACSSCHDLADARTFSPIVPHSMIDQQWLRGIYETQKTLIAEGLIRYTEN